jgi:transcriptional regulator with XRE-family HTH domain
MAAEHVRALGERIRLRREELGMTQDEVGRQMQGSVDGQRISKWERGENRPRDESLEDLARVLRTTPEALLLPLANGNATPDPFAGSDVLADRFDALERRVMEQLAEHARIVEGFLTRQDEALARIEQRLGEDRGIRDEIADLIDRTRREIAPADPPAAETDPPPGLEPTSASTKSPAKAQRSR